MQNLPLLAAAGFLFVAGCASPSSVVPASSPWSNAARAPQPEEIPTAVRAVLDAQVEKWNEGDVRGFMNGYAHTDSLAFLSGGNIRLGWEEALYSYVRSYPDAAAMGTLAFTDLTIRPLSADYAHVWGRWRLQRAADAPGGLFTLLFQRTDKGWRVVHDHTSSE